VFGDTLTFGTSFICFSETDYRNNSWQKL